MGLLRIKAGSVRLRVGGIPDTPDGAFAVPYDSTVVDLTWLPVQGITGYLVEVSNDGSSWSTLATVLTNKYRHTTVPSGATRYYRVKALSTGANSAPCSAVSVTTPGTRASRSLLRPGDFTYLGSFMPPFWLDPPTNSIHSGGGSNAGIAVRYVVGQLRLLAFTSVNYNYQLYEFTPPNTLATTPDVNNGYGYGNLVRLWGDPYNGKKLQYLSSFSTPSGNATLRDVLSVPVTDAYETSAVYWDASVNRLWISIGQYYNGGVFNHPTLLWATLNDVNHTITTTGPWKTNLSNVGIPNHHKCRGGNLPIPQWFADNYLGALGARRWALGFGGPRVGNADSSWGPALFAIDPANLTSGNAGVIGQTISPDEPGYMTGESVAATPRLATVCLVSTPYDNVHYCTRPPGYRINGLPRGWTTEQGALVNGIDQSAGLGRLQWYDRIYGGTCWIDNDAGTRSKHGVFVSAMFGFGGLAYKPKNLQGVQLVGGNAADGGYAHCFGTMDPAELGAVAQGVGHTYDPQILPNSWWIPDFPGADKRQIPYVGNFTGDGPQTTISGVAFDQTTNRLYVCQPDAWQRPGGGSTMPVIHVYDVAV
jgi:hypothetical protein